MLYDQTECGRSQLAFLSAGRGHLFVRQARGGGREVPESWAGCRRLPPKERADLFRPLGDGAGQKTKGGGRSPRGRGAQGAPRLSEGKPNATRGEGSPSLATRKRQGWRPKVLPLYFSGSVACGETPRVPFWAGLRGEGFFRVKMEPYRRDFSEEDARGIATSKARARTLGENRVLCTPFCSREEKARGAEQLDVGAGGATTKSQTPKPTAQRPQAHPTTHPRQGGR